MRWSKQQVVVVVVVVVVGCITRALGGENNKNPVCNLLFPHRTNELVKRHLTLTPACGGVQRGGAQHHHPCYNALALYRP
jgi:hypothetical protein